METVIPLAITAQKGMSCPSGRSSRLIRWLNGGVHWISAAVLIYAFVSNGETTHAMINPVAMKGEVKLGLAVGFIFLFRFLWVHNRRFGNGRWARLPVQSPRSTVGRLTNWGIYLGVAATVVSGFIIAYLRPGAVIIPGSRFFLTRRPSLNGAIHAHVFITDALEWLCAFHGAYALWYWLIKRSQWGRIAEGWLNRIASVAERAGVPQILLKRFRHCHCWRDSVWF